MTNIANVAAPYVPGFGGAMGASQTSLGAPAAAAGGAAAGMSPMAASLWGSAAIGAAPYVMELGAGAWDFLSNRNPINVDLDKTEAMWADLRGQEEAANLEAIRRARGTAGMALGREMAASGHAGLSGMNPALRGIARQGELQAGGLVARMERQRVQDRADYESSRAGALNQQIAGLGGRTYRKKSILEGYAAAAAQAGRGTDAERYRAAAASVA